MKQSEPHNRLALANPRYWPAWLGIFILWLIALLPYSWICALGRLVGRLGYRLASERRRIAEINLRLCFPDWDDARRERVLRENFESLGMGLFEIPLGWWAPDEKLRGLVHIEGLEHLQAALEKGKGAILLSAHFTSLDIGGRLLSLFTPFHAMYRAHDNPVVEKVMGGSRTKRVEKAIPKKNVREMIRSLKTNHAVWYAQDQNAGRSRGVFVDFFGHKASTNPATARLAKVSGAAVVPFYTVRRPDGSGYDLVLEPAWENFPTGDQEVDAQRVNDVIEGWVRKYPSQYLWIHRRFRSRPTPDEPSPYA